MFILTALVFCSNLSLAWFDMGHMLVAKIAYDMLDDKQKKEVNDLIYILRDAEPKYSDFVQSATWMDGLKATGFNYLNGEHYIDNNYITYKVEKLPENNPNNVIWAIKQSVKTFNGKNSSDFAKAFALRILIHLVGDIHQPLHTVSRITEKNKEGDRGGNSFAIEKIPFGMRYNKPSFIDNLHKLWDSGVTGFSNLEASDYPDNKEAVAKQAKDIENYINTLPEIEKQDIAKRIENKEYEKWAEESYNLAINNVYVGIEDGGKASEAYINNGMKITKIQVYIAGKRLAKLLAEIL